MAVLDIKVAGAPVLRKVAENVKKFDRKLLKLLNDMADTMYSADGVGLAAPQIGISQRIVVIDVGEGIIELINPVIIDKTGSCTHIEGCLSVPNFDGEVERFEKVSVNFYNRKGKPMNLEADGLLAVAVQHEIDHLDGVLFIDKATSLMPKEQ